MTRALLLLLCAGCATAPTPEPLPPATDADPLPHTPEPQESVRAGEGPTGLAMSGGFNEARSIAIRFLEALLAGEREVMERLLGDRVVITQPRLAATARQRDDVLMIALHPARRRVLDPSATLDSLVDLDGIEADTLERQIDDDRSEQTVPNGLEGTDVVLTVPLTPTGRRVLPLLLPGWRRQGKVIVRGGAAPRIVGI